MPAAGFSSPTNVDFHKCRHIQMSPHLSGYIHPQSHNSLVKNCIYVNQKSFQILMGKTITEFIEAFTERGIARRTWNGSTSIVDQNVSVDNVLSNPHRKVLGILLSDFLSRGSEHSLWRHHGLENKQLKSAQCQCKASAVSGSHICTVWHSAGISGKCRDIGIDFSGITACGLFMGSGQTILQKAEWKFLHYHQFQSIRYWCSH